MLASAGTFVKLVPQKLYCYLELLWMFERITQYLYASCYAYSKLANLYCCCGLEPQICNFLSLRHFHPPQLFQEKKRQCNQLGVVCSVWVAEKLETQRASFRKGSGAGGGLRMEFPLRWLLATWRMCVDTLEPLENPGRRVETVGLSTF